ncbi:MAG TPA: holo-ACP synthase [Pedobacter sp.]|nr:holo-ACP synthase [Pedobacter sp.]
MNEELLRSMELPSAIRNFAVGNDLVSLSTFEKTFNELFEKKVYTATEIAYCKLFADPLLRYAATWAAKEAVYKALKQVDHTLLSFKKIEIIRNKIGGMPIVKVHHQPKKPVQISLSISHDGDYAWAIAIVELL